MSKQSIKYIVTFDRSNEGIPTLIVSRESFYTLSQSMDIIRVITGSDALRIFDALSGNSESEEKR